MIKFLSSWIEQIAVAVILVSIFEMILPNGNIKKYVKMILSIYVVFNIIYPFVDSKALYNFDINDITNLTENSISNLNVNSNSRSIQEVNINEVEIGNKKNDSKTVSEEIDNIKNLLSSYYEIDSSKINIKLK